MLKSISAAGLGLALGASPTGARAQTQPATAPIAAASGGTRKRYAIVGLGSRSGMYQGAIEGAYKEHAELVGLCDTNPGRLALAQRKSKAREATPPQAYAPADFEKMLKEQKVDTVIITTMDSNHHEYIVRTMNAGCDAITEKPMTTTAEKAQQIIDAKAKTGKTCRVTFNYRYSPPRTQVKDILMSGEIGDILSVDFHWLLNTHHGADYFRRWHATKKNSGGLMIHKATHHFDLVNWWISGVPTEVFATAKREFYTPTMAKRMGLAGAHDRCLTCPEKDECGFYFDLAANRNLKELYLENEKYDGYHRDQCVWRQAPEDHNIEDTMNVLVKYDNRVTLAYSLNAFNSWEGYTIAFNGTKGRLEHSAVESVYVSGTDTVQGGIMPKGIKTIVIPIRGSAKSIEPWSGEGGHGGGDKVLLDDLFLPDPPADKYLRAADERAGAMSILIGVAANKCFETEQKVMVNELVTGLKSPDYTPMPSRHAPIPMPDGGKRA
ncbi:MAG TPA: Gfo/Idh/MocA family oxidoreductase [Tepidisphaeraceae bacterium]|nr:Gfo/Idh/MocA family oxidoreductase [Tepidisphaeraceae bacterium]